MFRYTGLIEHFCNAVNLLLLHLTFQDHHGILEIPPPDKSHPEKGFKLMEEDKCTAPGYFLFKVINLVKDGILVAKYLRVVIYQHMGAETIVGVDYQVHSVLLIRESYLFPDCIIVAFLFLFNYSGLLYRLNEHAGTAPHDRGFGTVYLNQRIVNTHSRKCCKNMLNGCNGGFALHQSRTP